MLIAFASVFFAAATASSSTASPRMQVIEWWCKQPQYSTTDAICARRAAEAAAVKAGKPLPELTREQKNQGALGVKGTPAQRRLAAAKTMQLRVKTFCDVPEHKAAKACEMMASRALCEREPKACPPGATAKLKSPRAAWLAGRKKASATGVKKSAL